MQRRAKSKRLVKAEQRFVTAVTEFILSLGAKSGSFYDYELDTPAGLLHISVHETWLATRFDDVARGVAFTKTCGYSSNPFSGKWNFHFGDGSAESLHPDRVLLQLRYYLEALMNWEAQAA
jgi:hypothetical protein